MHFWKNDFFNIKIWIHSLHLDAHGDEIETVEGQQDSQDGDADDTMNDDEIEANGECVSIVVSNDLGALSSTVF